MHLGRSGESVGGQVLRDIIPGWIFDCGWSPLYIVCRYVGEPPPPLITSLRLSDIAPIGVEV